MNLLVFFAVYPFVTLHRIPGNPEPHAVTPAADPPLRSSVASILLSFFRPTPGAPPAC